MAKKGGKSKSGKNKQFEAQRRREKRQNRKVGEQETYDSDMKIQLEKIGLALKEIPGDG